MLYLKAVKVTDNNYLCVSTLSEIRSNCPDPQRVDLSTEAERNKDPDLERAYKQRGDNQRAFNKARRGRKENYAEYIHAVTLGKQRGGFPPITLWTGEIGAYDDTRHILELAGGCVITANDGETQLAAWYTLAKDDPSWLDRPIAFTLKTDSNRKAAMQILHDMNNYATPVSEKETAVLNVEGPVTKAINEGVSLAGINASTAIKARGDKLPKGYLTTNNALLHGAVGVINGPDGLSRSPNSLIKKANAQFSDLGEKAVQVTTFIAEVLNLHEDVVSRITTDHMLALGAKFNETGQLYPPLSQAAYKVIDDRLKAERDGKRATISHRAMALYNHINNTAKQAA